LGERAQLCLKFGGVRRRVGAGPSEFDGDVLHVASRAQVNSYANHFLSI
jgi:hypothetical protein